MVKRILLSIVLLLVIAYLVVAVTAFNRKPAAQVCRDVELVIKDTVYAGFITKKEVATLLEKKGISPVGKALGTRVAPKPWSGNSPSIRSSTKWSATRPRAANSVSK